MTDWGTVDKPARRTSWLRRAGLRSSKALMALLSVAVLTVTGYGWQVIGSLNSGVTTTDVFDTEADAAPLDDAIDILLVGLDSRTDAQGNPLPQEALDKLRVGNADGERQTDTMILVHIPQDGRGAAAISFPRDSWVEIVGGYGSHKLNSAFAHAYNHTHQTLLQQGETDLEAVEEQAKVEGRKTLIATVEHLLGRPGMIDRYAEVNLASFYEVTKALGGVEVCLNNAVREKHSGINLPAGRQEIEGVQALAFVRQRYGLENGDLDRIARQQAFLSGLIRKMLSTEVLINPAKLHEVVGAVQKSVVLSKDWDLLKFAEQMRDLPGGNVEFHTLPVAGHARINGQAALELDIAEVRSFVDGLLDEDADDQSGSTSKIPGAEEFSVDVFVPPDAPELGPQVRELLRAQGFRGEEYAVAATVSDTIVYYAPGDESGAAAIRQALGPNVSAEPDATLPPGTLRLLVSTDVGLSSSAGAVVENRLDKSQGSFEPAVHTQRQDDTESDSPITAGELPCVD